MAKCKIAEDSSGIEEKFEELKNPKTRKLRHHRRLSSSASEDEQKLKSKTKPPNISHFPKPPPSLTGCIISKFGMNDIHMKIQQCPLECEKNPVL